MHLYLIGGEQKRSFVIGDDDEHRFKTAIIVRLDTDSGLASVETEYQSPMSVKCHPDSSNTFGSSTINNSILYTCTPTEVLLFKLPEFTPAGYVSLPCFHALHHVQPTSDGTLLIANTGLDMVMEINLDGEILREWNVLGAAAWGERFSKFTDYRRVVSTKPHRSHPNFVFRLGNEVWVTRFWQKDAVCLTTPNRRIEIGLERCHDGVLYEGSLYFTTVDGNLVVVDAENLAITSSIDLKAMSPNRSTLSGWCRGVLVADRHLVWVGFTRVRKTMIMDNLIWVKKGFREVDAPTRVALYDIKKRCCLKEINLEEHRINILFSIQPAD